MFEHLYAQTHPSWHADIKYALSLMDETYLYDLQIHDDYLPGAKQLFNAFRLAKPNLRYVLLGESPYPRQESANGYAFWDAAVDELWSSKGLSTRVNRATSLRNFIKMLLHADGYLSAPFLAQDIAQLDKRLFCSHLSELFMHMQEQGFLLLNASLVWSKSQPVRYHARAWQIFIQAILRQVLNDDPSIKFLLFGKIAEKLQDVPKENCIIAEHPYVLSFIQNPKVLDFFRPLHLLRKK